MYIKKKNTFNKIFYSRGMLALIIFLIIAVCYGLVPIIQKSIVVARDRKDSEIEAVDLQKKQTDLSQKIDSLQTPEGQTDALKEQYPFVKDGEKVIVITDDGNSSDASNTASTTANKKGFLSFLKNLF